MMQTTSANRVTPSMSAAAMIIEVRMSPPADGCRAVPSIASAPTLPMPKPAPSSASPTPNPAARYPSENWFTVRPPTSYASRPGRPGEADCRGVWTRGRRGPARVFLIKRRRRNRNYSARKRTSVSVLRHPDEDGREHGEHVCLHQRDEELEQEDSESECDRHRGDER